MLAHEIGSISDISPFCSNIPNIYVKGQILIGKDRDSLKKYSYFVMPYFGKSLSNFFEERCKNICYEEIMSIIS